MTVNSGNPWISPYSTLLFSSMGKNIISIQTNAKTCRQAWMSKQCKKYKWRENCVGTKTQQSCIHPITACGPVVVVCSRTGGLLGSVPDQSSSLSGVKHHRAKGNSHQSAPGGGFVKVGIASLFFCQLFEVHLHHPDVSVGEEEERGEMGVFFLWYDVQQEGVGVWTRGGGWGGGEEEVGRVASLGSLALLQLPGVDEWTGEELRSVWWLWVCCLEKQVRMFLFSHSFRLQLDLGLLNVYIWYLCCSHHCFFYIFTMCTLTRFYMLNKSLICCSVWCIYQPSQMTCSLSWAALWPGSVLSVPSWSAGAPQPQRRYTSGLD